MLSHDPEVGVKCRVIRGVAGEPVLDVGMLVGAVVVHDEVQLASGVGTGDLLQEGEELLVAVPVITGLGDRAGGHLEGGEEGGGSVAHVVMGCFFGKSGT
jgi:hypothetical protein